MKAELERKLAVRWPQWFTGESSPFPIECGDGWFSLIYKLCEDIAPYVPYDFRVMQIKEKFGGLRFYPAYGSIDAQNCDIVDQRINEAEDEALATCERCGQPGEVDYSRRWYRCRCLVCRIAEDNAAEKEDKQNAKDATS